ncbi:MAG TPA: lasso peptide biosynthesis B2 protein [Candidatus Elarobacter sp.]|jgi:hypothetical protein
MPAASIRHAAVDGFVVILDLRRGTYRLLDRVASAMWSALIGHAATDADAAVQTLLERFAVEPNRLRRDVAAFRATCIADGLLVTSDAGESTQRAAPRARSRRIVFPALAAWHHLAGTALLLRRRGFAAAYRAAAAFGGTSRAHFDEAVLDRACRAFARAENFFVARRAPDDCLPRSLALFRFLRAMGLPAVHVIGVRRAPFYAHAWVECNERVVLDADHRAELTTLARIAG